MEAIVLVGGQGSRLRPLTLTTPKPMLPAAGVPFLTHQLARARAAGVDHVVLATSYRPEVFTEHFGDGSSLGLRIDYCTEAEPLGTGGGIRNVSGRLDSAPDEPIVILNGDILSGHDIAAQVAAHRAASAAVTLHLVRVDDPRAFGSVPTDADGRVAAFVEKSPTPVSDQVNAGCYVFRRSVIDAIPAGRVVSVERETFPQLLADGAVVLGRVDDAYWLDVGTPAAYVQGSADLVRGAISSPVVDSPADRMVTAGADVADSATVSDGAFVDSGAVVGAGATVAGSVVMAGAHIGAGATVTRSVVGRDAVVGDDCVLDGVVIGDGARLGARNELRDGARLWPGVVLGDVALRFSSDA
jgi:mannose-1-phosphate guanylyltransferase